MGPRSLSPGASLLLAAPGPKVIPPTGDTGPALMPPSWMEGMNNKPRRSGKQSDLRIQQGLCTGYLSERGENVSTQRRVHKCSYQPARDRQEVEAALVSSNGGTDGKWGPPHSGVLFSHEKEWRSGTCYHMDEP